jgi:hypothetical protein
MFEHLTVRVTSGPNGFDHWSDDQRDLMRQIENDGWEAVAMTTLIRGDLLIMLKRPKQAEPWVEPELPKGITFGYL